MIDIDNIRAGGNHVRQNFGGIAANMQLCQRPLRVDVINQLFLAVAEEFPVEFRANNRTSRVADSDTMRAGPDLSGDKLPRVFDNNVGGVVDVVAE